MGFFFVLFLLKCLDSNINWWVFFFQPSDDGVASPPPPSDDSGPQLVIWGTDVVVNQCKAKFKRFILRFIDPEAEMDERGEGINVEEPLYLQKLKEVKLILAFNVIINFNLM